MATKQTKTPNPLDLYEQATVLFDEAHDRNALFAAMDDLYDAKPEAANDPHVQLVKMPLSTNTIDLVVDLASAQDISITVPAASEHKKDIAQADDSETWLRAMLDANQRTQHRNLTAEMAYLGAQRALVVMRTLYRESAVKEGEKVDGEYTLAGLPVLFQVRDPKHVVFDESAGELHMVAERWARKARSIRILYPGALDDDIDGNAEVEWCEVWTPKHVAYFVDGTPLRVAGKLIKPHRYGCIPYSFGTARTTPRPNLRYRPMLAGVQALAQNLDTAFSIMATAGWQVVVGGVNVFSDNYGRENGKHLDTTPGSVNYFAGNDRVEPFQRAALPGDFMELVQLWLQAYQAGTFPFAMFGQAPGSMAGYAINMLTQSGRRSIAPIWKAIESAYEGAFYNAITICRELVAPLIGTSDIPLYVSDTARVGDRDRRVKRTLKLDVTKTGPEWACEVRLSDPMPQDEAANLRMALEATKGGLLSQQTALTKFQVVDDALAEMERLAVEGIFKQLSPLEAVKLARERGYVPQKLELPQGWKLGQDGQIMPDLQPPQQLGMGLPQPGPQPMAQPQMPMPEQMPMPQPQGMTPDQMGQPPLDPAMLQMLMQGQGQPPMPAMPGPQELTEAGIDPAMMQAMAAQGPMMPDMEELSGAPPAAPMMGGF